MSTPILPFAVWQAGTNQNSIPANDNSLRNQILNGYVIGVANDEAGGDSDGDIYIVGSSPSGVFASFDEHDLAIYAGGTWYAFAPVEGIVVNLAGDAKYWDGADYVDWGGGGGGIPDAPSDGNLYGRKDGDWEQVTGGGGGASTTQTEECISGLIVTPDNGDYRIVVNSPHGGTITETTTVCASGSCTLTFNVNTTALGGTANSVSSSEQSQAHASSNTFAAGDDIVLTVSSNSSCSKMTFTIKYTRTLA